MKKIIAAALALTMVIGNGTALNVNAEETPLKNLSYYDYTDEDVAKRPQWAGYWTTDKSVTLYFAIADPNPEVYPEIPDYYPPSSYDDDDDRTDGRYKVQKFVNNKWKTIFEIGYNSAPYCETEIIGFKPYTKYKLRAIFYDYTTPDKVYKKVTTKPIIIRTCPKKTKITKVSAERDSVTLKWKKVKCAGYYIQQYSPDHNCYFTVKKVSGKASPAAKITNLESNCKYEFRVIPYGYVASKKYPTGFGTTLHNKVEAKPSKAVTIRTKN